MLKKVKAPEYKTYEVPDEKAREMGFFVEVQKVNGTLGEMVEVWLCRRNCGIKSFMFGLPFEQVEAGETYTYHGLLDIIEGNLYYGNSYVKGYLEDYCPEDCYLYDNDYSDVHDMVEDDCVIDDEEGSEDGWVRRCAGCGKELSYDECSDIVSRYVYDYLRSANEHNKFTIEEVLCGLSKTYTMIMDDFFQAYAKDKDKVDEIYSSSDDVVIDFIGQYSEANNNTIDPWALAFHFNNGCERMMGIAVDTLRKSDKE